MVRLAIAHPCATAHQPQLTTHDSRLTTHDSRNENLLHRRKYSYTRIIYHKQSISMIIYKFGGTSQANAARMKTVADIVTKDDKQKIVVLSAVSGTTDNLIKLSSLPTDEAQAIIYQMKKQYA